MSNKERIAQLEERLARAEGRVAELEARPDLPQIIVQPQPYPVDPQPYIQPWYQWYPPMYTTTCGSDTSIDSGMLTTTGINKQLT